MEEKTANATQKQILSIASWLLMPIRRVEMREKNSGTEKNAVELLAGVAIRIRVIWEPSYLVL